MIEISKSPLFCANQWHWAGKFAAVLTLTLLALPSVTMANPPVTVMTVKKTSIQYTQTLPARVTPFKVAEIRPQVTGIVTERLFKEGGMVEKGQQLYQIDPAPYQAVYDAAKADLLKARAILETTRAREERYARLVKDEAVSRQDYDDAHGALLQARASIAVAKASVDQAGINLNYTRVYAPITGRIGKSMVTEGALVTANQSQMLATITQLNPIYVDMQQAREKLTQLKQRSSRIRNIMVQLDSKDKNGPYPHLGQLQFSEVTVDPTTASVVLRALFPNPEELLYPGFFVNATLMLDKASVLLVPQKAVILQPGGKMAVWVVDKDKKVHPKPIQVEGTHGHNWIVTSGLSAGDTIVVEGFQRLRPGSLVTISPGNNSSTNAKLCLQP